jgi:outer membrane protein
MSLRSTLAAVAAALTLALPLAASAQTVKLGYVDVQRVIMEVEDGKAAKGRLEKLLKDRQKEIDGEQAALVKEKEVLEKQASAMSEETHTQKAGELQKKLIELAQKYDRYRAEAASLQNQEMEPIMGRIDQVIGKIAERDGFTFVFEKGAGLVYAQKQFDLTNDVIRNYNALPKVTAPKAPPTAKDAPMAKDAPVAKDAPKK